jgi:hypothetical protein
MYKERVLTQIFLCLFSFVRHQVCVVQILAASPNELLETEEQKKLGVYFNWNSHLLYRIRSPAGSNNGHALCTVPLR